MHFYKIRTYCVCVFRLLSLTIFIALLAGNVYAADHLLKFTKKIGIGSWIDWMSFVAFSPDGTTVASDGPTNPSDKAMDLTLWSFPEGRFIKTIPFRQSVISNDWKYLASEEGVINMQTGSPVPGLNENTGYNWGGVAFSSDSHYLAIGNGKRKNKHIRILQISNGETISEFGNRATFSLAFHPFESVLASGHWDNVTLWNYLTGERLELLSGFGRYVKSISFSRDGNFLAAGTDSGGLQIWDFKKHKRLHSIDFQYGDVSQPAFSPDGKLVAVGVYGAGTVFVIDVQTGAILDQARVSDMGCGSVAFSPDGRNLITPSTGGLITWPYDQGGTIRVFEVHPH